MAAAISSGLARLTDGRAEEDVVLDGFVLEHVCTRGVFTNGGTDGIDPDVMGSPLDGQHPGEVDDSRFGRAVGGAVVSSRRDPSIEATLIMLPPGGS